MLLGKVGALSFSERTTEDHGQGPEISMTIDPTELFLGVQPSRGEVARHSKKRNEPGTSVSNVAPGGVSVKRPWLSSANYRGAASGEFT